MQDLHQLLAETLSVCQNARSNLNKGQKSFTTASLGILSNYRKRKAVQDLLRSLNTIKTLVMYTTKVTLFRFPSSYLDFLDSSCKRKRD